uniref:Binding-protein-dependent transport systems inner membrane component n=1 Tax=uncultured bacterium contig00073 TaxID=1181552 RepID=A0A806KKY7_9BACT|nr:binding-protein-dependent transport systems inner membrane component [uncultured bacterium contig00073]
MIFSKFFQRIYDKYFHRKNDKLCLTLEGKNARAGYLFILPFLIGFISFMLLPVFESFRMVFSKITLDTANFGFKIDFTGLANLREALLIDAEYNRLLVEELVRMVLVVPAIIIFSLFVAMLLNQEFKMRGFVRAIFFLPVILSSGVMIGLETDNSLLSSMADTIRESNRMRSSVTGVLERILAVEGVTGNYMQYIFDVVNQIYTIAMASGIQIIIFLSALQTIPASVYEAAKIEGATAWECFWKITFPMISSLILVNIVYSVVDFFIRTDNTVMERISLVMINHLNFGLASAMAWLYFLIVIIVIGITFALISRKVYYYE